MGGMEAAVWLIGVGLCALFMLAAASKMHDSRALERTLIELGVARSTAHWSSRAAPSLEALLGAFFLLRMGSPDAVLIGLATGVGITAAGVAGLNASSPIPCGCFSNSSKMTLGWRQIVVGLLVAVGAVGAWAANASVPLNVAVPSLSAVTFLVACMQILALIPIVKRLSYARKAINL